MTKLRIRILTPGEESYLRRKNLSEIQFPGPLAILGPSNHPTVTSTLDSDNVKPYRVNLGGGDYMHELMGVLDADPGLTSQELWSIEQPIKYITAAAIEAKVPFFAGKYHRDLLYFQNPYNEAIIRCISFVDYNLRKYEAGRSTFDRWFGPACGTTWESQASKFIRSELAKFLYQVRTDPSAIGRNAPPQPRRP